MNNKKSIINRWNRKNNNNNLLHATHCMIHLTTASASVEPPPAVDLIGHANGAAKF